MRVVIAGGSGFLGRALSRALRQDGHQIQLLTRRAQGPDDIQWPGDGSAGDWTRALTGAAAVINLAGESIAAGRWTSVRKAAIRDSRIRATRALAAAISASRSPIAFLSGSAVGYYGLRGHETLTEAAPPGSDFLATVCRDWEGEARQAGEAARVVLLRTGLVLAADGGALPRMALPFRFGVGGRVGNGRQYMSWIHLDDWVGLVKSALTGTLEGPLNLTAPEPVSNGEFARALGAALHRPAFVPAPAFALRLALGEMAEGLLLGGQRVVPATAVARGFQFTYRTVDAALAAIYG